MKSDHDPSSENPGNPENLENPENPLDSHPSSNDVPTLDSSLNRSETVDKLQKSQALSTEGVLDRMQSNVDRRGFWNWFNRSFNPFRIATLRGIGIVLPPLLTIIIFFWIWNTLDRAILTPIEGLAQQAVYYFIDETRTNTEIKKAAMANQGDYVEFDGERVFVDSSNDRFAQIKSRWIPLEVAEVVRDNPGKEPLLTSKDYYLRYIRLTYLKRHLVIPAFLALFTVLLYLIGKLLAVRIGRLIYYYFEHLVTRLPIIRNVYSSVKQVTDFAFSESEVQFNRVVAVEYPRKGIWSIGFVTGEGFRQVREFTGEPMLSLLMPTSPMPATGFTITVAKSETIDLDLTIDQAIQYCVSCGVVVPNHQSPKQLIEGLAKDKLNQVQSSG